MKEIIYNALRAWNSRFDWEGKAELKDNVLTLKMDDGREFQVELVQTKLATPFDPDYAEPATWGRS